MIQLGFIKDSLKSDYLFWNELFTKLSFWQVRSYRIFLSKLFLSRFFLCSVCRSVRLISGPYKQLTLVLTVWCLTKEPLPSRTDWVCGGNITLLRKSLNTICIRSKLSHEIQYFNTTFFGELDLSTPLSQVQLNEKMFNNDKMAQRKNIVRRKYKSTIIVLSVRKVLTKMTFSSAKSQFNPISKLVKYGSGSQQSSLDTKKVQFRKSEPSSRPSDRKLVAYQLLVEDQKFHFDVNTVLD